MTYFWQLRGAQHFWRLTRRHKYIFGYFSSKRHINIMARLLGTWKVFMHSRWGSQNILHVEGGACKHLSSMIISTLPHSHRNWRQLPKYYLDSYCQKLSRLTLPEMIISTLPHSHRSWWQLPKYYLDSYYQKLKCQHRVGGGGSVLPHFGMVGRFRGDDPVFDIFNPIG